MFKMKLTLRVVFSLCCFTVVVFGSIGSEVEQSESETTTEKPVENFEGLFGYVKTLEKRIRELEKSQEECKSLKTSFEKSQDEFKSLKTFNEKSQEEFKEQIKSLIIQVDEMKNGTRRDHGVRLLTPRLRGPPGKPGEPGQKGEVGEPGPKGDRGILAPESIKSCSVAMESLPSTRSTKQWIYPHGNSTSKVEVLCDFQVDGGGWTVIQKRTSGPRDEFNQTWNEYVAGFGSLDGNFWLGLENIHALTKNSDQELRIQLEDFEGNKAFAKYSRFSISDASDFYRLEISGFSRDSTAGDSMANSALGASGVLNGMRFTTKDNDNDNHSGNCAVDYPGGWWFKSCFFAHLNGIYLEKGQTGTGIYWNTWSGGISQAKTEMKIRTRKSP